MIEGSKDSRNHSIGGLGSAQEGIWNRFLRYLTINAQKPAKNLQWSKIAKMPPWAEWRPPMESSHLHFKLLIASQLPKGWHVAPFYGPETMTKIFQIY